MHNVLMVSSRDVAEAVEALAVAWVRTLAEPHRLSLSAAATLATLSRRGPCSVSELAASEHVSQPAMTQLVGRLERDGLVTRRQGGDGDRRVVSVAITPEGQRLLAQRRRSRRQALGELLDRLDPEEESALAQALPVLRRLASLAHERSAAAAR